MTRALASTTPRPRSPRCCGSTPANELADRYPGRLAGTIGDAALSSPNSLIIIIGHTPAQLADTPDSVQVTSIATTVPGRFDHQLNPKGLAYSRPTRESSRAASTSSCRSWRWAC